MNAEADCLVLDTPWTTDILPRVELRFYLLMALASYSTGLTLKHLFASGRLIATTTLPDGSLHYLGEGEGPYVPQGSVADDGTARFREFESVIMDLVRCTDVRELYDREWTFVVLFQQARIHVQLVAHRSPDGETIQANLRVEPTLVPTARAALAAFSESGPRLLCSAVQASMQPLVLTFNMETEGRERVAPG